MASSINASVSGAGGLISTADNSGILNIQTASTNAVTIDTSQNVGIGTTSPSQVLDVVRSQSSDTTIRVYNSSTNAAARSVYLLGNDTNAAISGLVQNSSTNTAMGGANSFNVYQGLAAPLTFLTAGAERMRIDSSGNVLVGTTSSIASPAEKFTLAGSVAGYLVAWQNSSANPTGLDLNYSGAAPNGAGNFFALFRDTGANRFIFKSNGGLNNYSANNTNLSDLREKTNIELAGSYLDKICAIPVKTFNYIDQNMEEDGGLNLGVIAQDVQAVAPELVTESNWGTEEKPKERLSIYQTDLQYALMKCIQEQQTIINDLKARVTALEAK